MMGRAEMQMLRTGDLAGGGGERRALNLFPHTDPRECSGATCGLEKVEPAPGREPLQGSGRWGQWPAGAPALLWAPPHSRRGKGGASGSADGLRTGLPQLWSVDREGKGYRVLSTWRCPLCRAPLHGLRCHLVPTGQPYPAPPPPPALTVPRWVFRTVTQEPLNPR